MALFAISPTTIGDTGRQHYTVPVQIPHPRIMSSFDDVEIETE